MLTQRIHSKKRTKTSTQVSFTFLIEKKRDGGEFTEDEARYIVDAVLEKEIPPDQMAALLMAIFFKGMTTQETAHFVEEMKLSGEILDLSQLTKPIVDKYTIGSSVGDKTALVLPPLVAACGAAMPTLLGSDEDFLISNLDKLQAILKCKVAFPLNNLKKQIRSIHCALVEQNAAIAPVDTILYRMREITATIPSFPLIVASILSKKLAEGVQGLVLDIKWGSGSFIKKPDEAEQLARVSTHVARRLQRRCVTLITDLNQPLGDSIGLALEVKEAIALLKGEGPEDLKKLIFALAKEMIRLVGVEGSTLSAEKRVRKHLKDGSALEKFQQMVEAQGGDSRYIKDPEQLPKAKYTRPLPATKRGYVHSIHPGMMARGVQLLALNQKKRLDPAVGVSHILKLGSQVKQGEPLMQIHYNDEERLKNALEYLKTAYRLAPKRPDVRNLIVKRVA